ncbi:MAG: S1 RNA-binding domain-containing protein [Firmicutes bacterium]|nr:S1 RNA-binding domain-containing protein [Bacillota bacterium]
MALEVGQIVEGKVTGITNFGAFIELPDGQTGLVHISEVAAEYVKDINQFLKQNDLVKVKVLNMDKGKIGLSIRQAQPRIERAPKQNNQNFEDKLAKFLRDSEERQSMLRRNADSKRGGRGGGRMPSM